MNTHEILRQIYILFYSLLAGQVLFCAMILFAILDPATRQSGWPAAPFGTFVPVVIAVMIPIALTISRKRLASGAAEPDLAAKLNHYRSVVILRSALLEGANLFCLVIFLLENNLTYLYFFAAGLLVFFYLRPSEDEFSQHYQLSSAERAELAG